MMKPEEDQLLSRYLDDRLSEADHAALQDLLRRRPEARRRLRLMATVTEGISGREVAVTATEPRGKQSMIPWLIAVAATILAVAGWFWRPAAKTKVRPDIAVNSTTSEDSFLALLVNEAGAEFEGDNTPDSVRFQEGSYQLAKGVVHIRFANGADVVMKAPASFEIEDAFHVRVQQGLLRAIVPPSAKGFTIATPDVHYEDLGTEFALAVDAQTEVSQLHVLDGRVDAKHPDSNELISSVTQGQSVQFNKADAIEIDTPNLDSFPTPGAIGFLRWDKQRADFGTADSDLIGYYPFVESEELENRAPNKVAGNGQIKGARWVSGRWAGKSALLFDRDTDFVELNVPGEYDELSFAAWLKIDRYDHSHNAIFISNGWSKGDIHWQIFRNRTMDLTYFGSLRQHRRILKEIPTGQWIHVVGVISRKHKENRMYLNGEVAGVISTEPKELATPGMCRIGNWLMEQPDQAPVRALRGKIDEFAIWKRALADDEIKVLVEKGKPSALWPMDGDRK